MLTPSDEPSDGEAEFRADTASDSVRALYGRRLLGLPGTHLAAVTYPCRVRPGPWHYWWQAHYLDCLVDAGRRESARAARDPREPATGLSSGQASTARRLLHGIWLRNGLHWTNSYYDDMAWLALATHRLQSTGDGGGRVIPPLERALASAHTQHLGGGLFWNTARDFKNTPATGPAALFFARRGDTGRAQELVDWLRSNLWDAESGLYLDGIRLASGGAQLEPAVYSYNQGPVLGALLALGGAANIAQAADLVTAVTTRLATGGVLRTHGGGDGGLFTGILARYLACAALSPALPEAVRRAARVLVTTTADTLWAHRAAPVPPLTPGKRRRALVIFPEGTGGEAPAGPTGLSTQLQAWMILEAAYRVTAGEAGSGAP